MKLKTKIYNIPSVVQKLFVAFAVFAYAVQLVVTIDIVARVYQGGIRLSPFLVVALEAVAFPIILFALAYVMFHKSVPALAKTFMATLFAVMALLFEALLTQTLMYSVGSFVAISSLAWSAAYETIPAVITMAAFLLVLMRYRNAKIKAGVVSKTVQKTFAALVLGTIFLQGAVVLHRVITQYPSNPNLSGFLTTSIEGILLPALFFIVAFVAASKKLTNVSRVFQASLFTVIGMLFFAAISTVFTYSYNYFFVLDGSYWLNVVDNLVVAILVAVSYVAAVICYRRDFN